VSYTRHDRRNEGQVDEEEDVSISWMNLRKPEVTGNYNREH
jgi:hypothetical protein